MIDERYRGMVIGVANNITVVFNLEAQPKIDDRLTVIFRKLDHEQSTQGLDGMRGEQFPDRAVLSRCKSAFRLRGSVYPRKVKVGGLQKEWRTKWSQLKMYKRQSPVMA